MSKIGETGDKERFEIRHTIGWVSICDGGEPILHVVRDDSQQNPDPTLRPAVSKETQASAEMILSALRAYTSVRDPDARCRDIERERNAEIQSRDRSERERDLAMIKRDDAREDARRCESKLVEVAGERDRMRDERDEAKNAYRCLCEMQLADAQTLERVVAERDAAARERDEARKLAALAMGEANTAMADAFAESKRAAQCERYAALYLALRDSGRFAPGVGGAGWASACRRPEMMDDADRAALDAAAEALLPAPTDADQDVEFVTSACHECGGSGYQRGVKCGCADGVALIPEKAPATKAGATCWGITEPAAGWRRDEAYSGCQTTYEVDQGISPKCNPALNITGTYQEVNDRKDAERYRALRAATDDEYLVVGDGRAAYSPSELDALADEIIKDMTEGGQE